MSSKVAPEDEAIIAELMEIGEYDDSTQVIHEALMGRLRQVKLDRVRALVQESEDELARGEYEIVEPGSIGQFMSRIREEAMEMNRRDLPLNPDVCG
jgi:hypothetical protein